MLWHILFSTLLSISTPSALATKASIEHTCVVGPGPFSETPDETLYTMELQIKPETYSESKNTVQIEVKQKGELGSYVYKEVLPFSVTKGSGPGMKIFTSKSLDILGTHEIVQLNNASLDPKALTMPALMILTDEKPVDVLGLAYCTQKI